MVIDIQNGFVSKGGSYDMLGMDVSHYHIIEKSSQEFVI